jgi:ribosome maturation factor RimP
MVGLLSCNYIQASRACKRHASPRTAPAPPKVSEIAAATRCRRVPSLLSRPEICYTSRLCKNDGRLAHFLFVAQDFAMDLQRLLESTLSGLGYELVDVERSGKGKLLRIYIDKPGGIDVEDCAKVSHHLSRVFTVEGIDYDRLEVSSPGLDRPLKKEQDFARYSGQKARIRMRVPIAGQRNFVGVLRDTRAGKVEIEVEDGKTVSLDLANLEKARLVPAV